MYCSCVAIVPAFARILCGLTLTKELNYQEYVFNNQEGFLVEAARLKTGDFLVRVPHDFNNFMVCNDLLHIMCIEDCNYGYIIANKAVWVPGEEVAFAGNKMFYDRFMSMYDLSGRKLSGMTLRWANKKPTTRNTSLEKISYYNNVFFMQQLYLMQNRRLDYGFITRYAEKGPAHLEQAIKESGINPLYLDLRY